jgi:hypothetical protein
MKGRFIIAGALLFAAVYVSSCMVSRGGYNHHDRGYREGRGGRGGHNDGGVRHYGR